MKKDKTGTPPIDAGRLLSTREVAHFLNINEKMVYALISEKGLPASKITGKWLFPRHLVEQWVETHTLNYPETAGDAEPCRAALVITGSNDLLLDRLINLFNQLNNDLIAVFGNLGSMGGLRALRQNRCHMATSHLLQEDAGDYNFEFAGKEMERMPAVLNLCRREQGIVVARGNPLGIAGIADLGRPGVRIINRPLGTGTRLLLDRELKAAGIDPGGIPGYEKEVSRHMEVGIAVLSGQADAGPAIRPAAALLRLDFVPLRWERFDLLIRKERFFDEKIQRFISAIHHRRFRRLADGMEGYDLGMSGRMIFPDGP